MKAAWHHISFKNFHRTYPAGPLFFPKKALFNISSEGRPVASKHQLLAFSHRLFRIACEMKVKDTLGLATQPQSNMTKP